jgi:electron transfer flavoprotein beta subunit
MDMNILVCIKQIPDVGGKIKLSDDSRNIDTKNLGFTISPHEECAVEQAIQLVNQEGGSATVLTLGIAGSEEQLRDSLARGMDKGVLLHTDNNNWNANQTANAITDTIRKLESDNGIFDLILFGGESADRGNAQVGILVAQTLDRPSVNGINGLEIAGNMALVKRDSDDGIENYELDLPAVLSVRDGMNLPRFPSLRGTLMAKKKPIQIIEVEPDETGTTFLKFERPPEQGKQAVILGRGPEAAANVVQVLKKLELV